MYFKRKAKRIIAIISYFIFLGYSNITLAKNKVFIKTNIKSSELSIKPGRGNKSTFKTDIIVSPKQNNINLVGFTINFDKKKLKVKKINFAGSFCNLFIENKIDNENGKVDINCGSPFPGLNEEATVVQLEFERLEKGATIISFDDSSMVLANDGFGTNVLKASNDLKIE